MVRSADRWSLFLIIQRSKSSIAQFAETSDIDIDHGQKDPPKQIENPIKYQSFYRLKKASGLSAAGFFLFFSFFDSKCPHIDRFQNQTIVLKYHFIYKNF